MVSRRVVLAMLLLTWPVLAIADPLHGGGGSGGEAMWLPDALRPLAAWLLVTQRGLIVDLQRQMALIQDGGSWAASLAIIASATLYGSVHAAGPGHGKIVVASYFASRRARLVQALRLSGLVAVQAASAIALVSVLAGLLDLGGRTLLDGAALFETTSFALIGLFGLLVMWRAARGRAVCCDHTHDHQHVHGPDCHHHPSGDEASRGEMLMGALAVGLRPCTGAVLILLFTFANGLAWLGIVATLAMAAGSAVTVAAVGIGAVSARSLSSRLGLRPPSWLAKAMAITAGLLIAVSGGAMAVASRLIGPIG